MDVLSKENLLLHIKRGQYLARPVASVKKILEDSDMGIYARSCCERIRAAGFVDEYHITEDFPETWDLLTDIYGIKRCKDILQGYLLPEAYSEIEDAMQYLHDYSRIHNNTLYVLRSSSKEQLKELINANSEPEYQKYMKELINAELKTRNPCTSIIRICHRFIFTIRILSYFRPPLWLQPKVFMSAWIRYEGCNAGTDSGKYSKAFERFKAKWNKRMNFRRMKKDDLMKYVFLGVKAFGRESGNTQRYEKVKSCLEIKAAYEECKNVMDAIGMLTPGDLQQAFPITKKYNGNKYEEKDYFYTVDVLNRMNPKGLIGDANDAACLLWDYQNMDLEFFLVRWMHVTDDLSIYCSEDGPSKKFHERLSKRAKTNEK